MKNHSNKKSGSKYLQIKFFARVFKNGFNINNNIAIDVYNNIFKIQHFFKIFSLTFIKLEVAFFGVSNPLYKIRIEGEKKVKNVITQNSV